MSGWSSAMKRCRNSAKVRRSAGGEGGEQLLCGGHRDFLGFLEIWRFVTDLHHPVHLHLASFQVLARNGKTPGPFDHGWKDTIDLRPAESAEIAVRFTDHAGRFVFDCHNLEHEDMTMMADFITT